LEAAHGGYLPAVKRLLAGGANRREPDASGFTALVYARQKGYEEIAATLTAAVKAR
jgi:hypothetical protein